MRDELLLVVIIFHFGLLKKNTFSPRFQVSTYPRTLRRITLQGLKQHHQTNTSGLYFSFIYLFIEVFTNLFIIYN